MSGPATNQNITLQAGDTLKIYIPILEDDGTPVDLTGMNRARWWLTKSAKAMDDDDIYLTKDSNKTMVCDDGVTRNEIEADQYETDKWRLVIHLKGADTETGVTKIPKTGATYYHEVEIVYADGSIGTSTTGAAVVAPSVIRNL